MAAGQFSAPVLVRITLPSGSALQAIQDPRSALTVLSRGWLGGFPLDWPDYATCLEKLGRAVIDPRPERVEVARQAFCAFAEHVQHASRTLARSDGLTITG